MGVARSTDNAAAGSSLAPAEAHRLCGRVAEGDRAAAEILATAVMPTARTIARRLTRTRSDAQDATQLAVLEILRAAGTYRGEGSLRGWAKTIAVRTVGRWCARVAARRPEAPLDPDTVPTPHDDAAGELADGLPRGVAEYLAQLPAAQRNAILLRHAYGCTVPEIAEITESPVPTVKSRLKAGLDELRRAVRRDVQLGVRAGGAS